MSGGHHSNQTARLRDSILNAHSADVTEDLVAQLQQLSAADLRYVLMDSPVKARTMRALQEWATALRTASLLQYVRILLTLRLTAEELQEANPLISALGSRADATKVPEEQAAILQLLQKWRRQQPSRQLFFPASLVHNQAMNAPYS